MKKPYTLHIDCRVDTTPARVHARIAEQLHFPVYYGANLDALQDCLSEVLLERRVVVEWRDTPASKRSKGLRAIHTLLSRIAST
jgi:RNAse (barnase) inhibitor barstar